MYVCDEAWDRDVWSAEMFQCSLERKIETRLLVTPRLQIGSKSAQINTWIWSRIGRYFSDRFGFQVADLENRRTDANRTRKSGPKSARNRLDRTGLTVASFRFGQQGRDTRHETNVFLLFVLQLWSVEEESLNQTIIITIIIIIVNHNSQTLPYHSIFISYHIISFHSVSSLWNY